MAKRKSKKKWTWASWYADNKERLNKQRADRYEKDPEYREAAINRSRADYRKKNNILSNGMQVLISEGEEFVGIRISEAAEILGTDKQTILRYMSLGYLPSMEFENTQLKFITVDQMPIVEKFFERVASTPVRKGYVAEIAAKMKPQLEKKWRKRSDSQKIIAKEG